MAQRLTYKVSWRIVITPSVLRVAAKIARATEEGAIGLIAEVHFAFISAFVVGGPVRRCRARLEIACIVRHAPVAGPKSTIVSSVVVWLVFDVAH